MTKRYNSRTAQTFPKLKTRQPLLNSPPARRHPTTTPSVRNRAFHVRALHRLARPSLTIASLLFVRARGSSQGSSTVTGEAVGEGEGEGTVRCGPSIHSARCCLQRPAPRGQSKTPDHIFPDPAELKASRRLFQSSLSCRALFSYQRYHLPKTLVLTPVSDIKGLPYLLRQGELLRLREPQKWILRPIWGIGGDS